MYNFNIFNSPEPLEMYLCKPTKEIICQLNGIDISTASCKKKTNNKYDLSFDYDRYINYENGEIVESNGYQLISIRILIYVESIGYFKIKYPPYTYNGDKEYKHIEAFSIDSELEDKDLSNFKINTGESDSLEYLVTYEENETEPLINEYTGLPFDYIVFYNTFPEQLQELYGKYVDGSYSDENVISEIKSFCTLIPRLKSLVKKDDNGDMYLTEYVSYTYDSSGENIIEVYLANFNERISQLINFYTKYRKQLSLLDLAIEKCNCNWSIGDVDKSLVNKRFQFSVENENIYAFLTQDVSSTAKCLIQFDLFQCKINATLADDFGDDSGVIISKTSLLNSVEITCDEDSIYTRYNVLGGNDLGISLVNFGSNRIDDITYFLHARTDDGERIYVTDELAEKYMQFIDDREHARSEYITLTKQYNQCLIDIDELKYKVPNDCVFTDWSTYTLEELEAALSSYNNLLCTLQSLYKEDFGSAGCNADGSINEEYIKGTFYWYDYYAYKQTIKQIEEAIIAYSNGSSYSKIYNDEILQKINAYKTEWSLYGTIELQNKIIAYDNSLQILIDGESIILKDNSDEPKSWEDLSSTEKTEYGNLEINYGYGTYMKLYNERKSCQEYLDTLLLQLEELENIQNTLQNNRVSLIKLITIEGYDRIALANIISLSNPDVDGKFTESEIQTINFLYIDNTYSNENIMTTSLENIVTEIDVQKELLEDAKEELSIASQPQVSFNADIDNLLCMPEFKDFKFDIGNFVMVEYYDDYYVRLRLDSITFNPCIPTDDLQVSFTNFVKSRTQLSDVAYLLSQNSGSSSSSGGGHSGNGNGTFGTGSNIDITLSNTMLAKLLNTEMFGTRVSNIILDTIKVNELSAKYAKFDGLANGITEINGECIKTGAILSNNYNGTITKNSYGVVTNYGLDNTTGSIIELKTGKFNFGGGNLTWDNSILKVKGDITANSGYIGGTSGFVISTNKMYSNGHSSYNSSVDGIYIGNDYISLGSGGVTYFKNDGTGQIGIWIVTKTSIYKGSSSWGTSGGMYFGNSGLSISDKFKVDASGNLTSTGTISFANGKLKYDGSTLTINGSVTANTGSIGGWNIDSTRIYKSTTDGDNKSKYVFMSSNFYNSSNDVPYNPVFGVKYDNTWQFYVRSNGELYAKNANIEGKITATSGSIAGNLVTSGINANNLTTGVIKSSNYAYSSGNYSTAGTCLDLSNGVIRSKNFGIDSSGNAYFKGNMTATSGNIGGFTITSSSLYNGTNSISSTSAGVYLGTNGFRNYKDDTHYTTISDGVINTQGGIFNSGVFNKGTFTDIVLKNNVSLQYAEEIITYTAIQILNSGAGEILTDHSMYFGNGQLPIFIVGSPLVFKTYNNSEHFRFWGVSNTCNGTIVDMGTLNAQQINENGVSLSSKYVSSTNGTLTWKLKDESISVALRRSGSAGSYGLSLVTTDASGNNTFNTLITSSGGRNWALPDHTHNYLPLTGGVLSGTLKLKVSNGGTGYYAVGSADGSAVVSNISCHTNTSGTYYLTVVGKFDNINESYESHSIVSASSDARLKYNISNSNIYAMDVINAMQVRQFTWKQKNSYQKIGFVADELEKLDPKLAFGGGYNPDGSMNIKSVDTFYLLGYVVKGMQELYAENKALQQELMELKQKYES